MTPESPDFADEAPPPRESEPETARRRAAAYLDLWEGHLMHLAAEGAAPARPARSRRS